MSKASERLQQSSDMISRATRSTLIFFGATVALASLAFAIGVAAGWEDAIQVFVVALGVVASAALLGGFLGLLFGIPREVDRQEAAQSKARFALNSNLLKVSDWVTTVLVGLSLVSLRGVPNAVADFGEALKAPLGNKAGSAAFGICLAGAGLTAGFLLMYVYTTIALRNLLEGTARDVERTWREELQGQVEKATPDQLDLWQSDESAPDEVRALAAEEAQRRTAAARAFDYVRRSLEEVRGDDLSSTESEDDLATGQ